MTDLAGDDDALRSRLDAVEARLRPMHRRPPPVHPGDWLDVHQEEHQDLASYVASRPARALDARRHLDVVAIGEVPAAAETIVATTLDLLGAVFGLPTRRASARTLAIPASARRRAPGCGREQLLTSWLRDRLLLPRVADDTAVVLGLTAFDLWPRHGWNFVFGEASLRERVGVWSLARFGDPVLERELCLRRTLVTAVHETAHMFWVPHCVAFECLMAGSNSLEEADERPLWLCPVCLAKVCWATRRDPAAHLQAVALVLRSAGLEVEACLHERAFQACDRSRQVERGLEVELSVRAGPPGVEASGPDPR